MSDSKAPASLHLSTDPQVDVPWCDLFNSRDFFALHPRPRQSYFSLRNEAGVVVAVAHFSELQPGVFRSPGRGTYGGIDLLRPDPLVIEYFLEEIEKFAGDQGMRTLRMRLAPFAHDPVRAAFVCHALMRRGWSVEESELNFWLATAPGDLITRMKRNNQRRVRKAKKAGFEAMLIPVSELRSVFEVIDQNRSTRGFDLSMSYDQIIEMAETFPDQMRLYGAESEGELIASAICMKPNPRILYVYAWGHLPSHHAYSPVAFLANGMHDLARDEGVELIDVGTVPVEGGDELRRFKERLGCQASLVLSFVKTL